MAKSAEQHLKHLEALVDDVTRAQRQVERMHDRIDRKMVEAREAGVSLRAIAEVVGVSDVTVLNRTRDALAAKST